MPHTDNPPAATEGTFDVREALRDIIRGGSYSRFPGDLPYADVVDRILSDPRIEVRPHGTVPAEQISDAGIEWEPVEAPREVQR